MNDTIRSTTLSLAISVAALMTPALASADGEGLMLGAGGYYSYVDERFNLDKFESIEDVNFDDSSFSFNLSGGWRFNKWLALEGGYWDLGEYKADAVADGGRKRSFDSTAWTLGGIVSVPLWILDIYGRGGVAMWDMDGRTIDEDGSDPYYGVGVALNIGGSIDIYLEWVRFDLETDLDSAGLGVRFTF